MNQDNMFVAGLLRQGSRILAGDAARSFLANNKNNSLGFAFDPFTGWQNWLATRIEELAAAIAVKRPQLFVTQIVWARTVLETREIDPESFRASLTCLREILASELPEAAQPLALEYMDQALAKFDGPADDLSARLVPDTDIRRQAATYLLRLLEGDHHHAYQILDQLFDQGHDVGSIYMQVLMPAQEELGRMWMANEINIAEEHLISAATKQFMAQLISRAPRKSAHGKTLLAACVAGNEHDIGLQAIADCFALDGWRAILLGANVPTRDLVQAVDFFSADLIGLSVSLTTQLEVVRETIQAVREGRPENSIKILLGGGALAGQDGLPNELGADGYATNPATAVVLGRKLVGLD